MDERTNEDVDIKVDPEVIRVDVRRSGKSGSDNANRADQGPAVDFGGNASAGHGRRKTVSVRIGNTGMRVHVPLLQLILGVLAFAAVLALLVALFIAALPLLAVIACVMLVFGVIGTLTRAGRHRRR